METENKPKYINEILKTPLWTFIISFGLGTFILLLFLVCMVNKDNPDKVIITGIIYVFAATVINLALLLFLIVCAIIHKEYRKQLLERTAVMLLNIPIVILYLFIVTGF